MRIVSRTIELVVQLRVTMRTKDAWLAAIAGYCFTVSMLDPLIMTPVIPMVVLLLAVMQAGSRDSAQREPSLS